MLKTVSAWILLVGLCACPANPPQRPDAGLSEAGPGLDAAQQIPDLGTPPTPSRDASVAADVQAPSDISLVSDVAVVPRVDATTLADAGAPVDTGEQVDVGSQDDAGAQTDAGVEVDGGAQADAGARRTRQGPQGHTGWTPRTESQQRAAPPGATPGRGPPGS